MPAACIVVTVLSLYILTYVNSKIEFLSLQKLEWESLSVDLLPHPDMFADGSIARTQEEGNQRGDDGAKRAFFGGERFIEGISGEANVMHIIHFKLILVKFVFC